MKISDLKNQFKDKELLELALTHKSWVNENLNIRRSNERLEFLGDAILEYIITDFLYERLPDKEEGFLTNLRANIVNTKNLSKFAKELEIGDEISLSKGESESGKSNPSVLADTVEAIIGGIYLDRGLTEVKNFILNNLVSDFEEKLKEPLKDAKSTLQEMVQRKSHYSPRYKVVKSVGPDHAREFTIEVWVNGKMLGTGVGKNKSEAQQKAASVALEAL